MDAPALQALTDALAIGRAPVETACRLVENLLGKPCKVAGEMLADQIYAWQWQNRVRVLERAQQIIEQDNLAARVLPPGFLMPLLEAVGSVDDPDLQELWAKLLASAVGDDANQHPMYIDVLRRLSPEDARAFRDRYEDGRVDSWHTANAFFGPLRRLIALQLLDSSPPSGPARMLTISPFGHDFADAIGLIGIQRPSSGRRPESSGTALE